MPRHGSCLLADNVSDVAVRIHDRRIVNFIDIILIEHELVDRAEGACDGLRDPRTNQVEPEGHKYSEGTGTH
jgi:hypothetical protein